MLLTRFPQQICRALAETNAAACTCKPLRAGLGCGSLIRRPDSALLRDAGERWKCREKQA